MERRRQSERRQSSLSLSSTLTWQFYYEERWVVEKWNLSRSLFSLPLHRCLSHFSPLFLLVLLLHFPPQSFPPLSSRFLSVSIAPMCLPPKWKRIALIFRPLLDDYHFIFQLPIIPLLPLFIAPFSFSLSFPSILSPSFSHSACTAVIHATEQ